MTRVEGRGGDRRIYEHRRTLSADNITIEKNNSERT
jgi:hypothetical protein